MDLTKKEGLGILLAVLGMGITLFANRRQWAMLSGVFTYVVPFYLFVIVDLLTGRIPTTVEEVISNVDSVYGILRITTFGFFMTGMSLFVVPYESNLILIVTISLTVMLVVNLLYYVDNPTFWPEE